jgi:hypothetical protein
MLEADLILCLVVIFAPSSFQPGDFLPHIVQDRLRAIDSADHKFRLSGNLHFLPAQRNTPEVQPDSFLYLSLYG